MTEAKTKTVEPEQQEVRDDTPELVLWTWGLSSQPASWAPIGWTHTIETIRLANTGKGDAATVQAALDAAFPDDDYAASKVMLPHEPVGAFTAAPYESGVRVDLDGDEDLLLPDENVTWDFGDGTVIHDAGGWPHEYGADGEYEIRLTVLVAGVAYTSTETVTIGDEVVPVETVNPAYAERSATVFESETDGQPNHNAGPIDEEAAEDEEYDPADHTVDEVLAYAEDHPDEVGAIRVAEEQGKARVGVLDKL